jgi:hypothetical protein
MQDHGLAADRNRSDASGDDPLADEHPAPARGTAKMPGFEPSLEVQDSFLELGPGEPVALKPEAVVEQTRGHAALRGMV